MADFRDLIEKFQHPSIRAGIAMGQYMISIQASEVHYCEPMEALESVWDYDSFEVAIFRDGKFVTAQDVNDPVGRLLESLPAFSGEGDSVFGYIRTRDVQELYDKMSKLLNE